MDVTCVPILGKSDHGGDPTLGLMAVYKKGTLLYFRMNLRISIADFFDWPGMTAPERKFFLEKAT